MPAIKKASARRAAAAAASRTRASPLGLLFGSSLLAGAVFCGAAGLLSGGSNDGFESSAEQAAAAATATQQIDYASIETGSLATIYVVSAANCTALELDRDSNQTTAGACPEEGLSLRMEPYEPRSDLAILASGYIEP